jgi:predicted  nucleic acid-binding Zn-ribbon protein
MTTSRQLFSLQEFDLALDQIDTQKAEANSESGSGGGAAAVEAALESEQQNLEAVRSMHREQQTGAEDQRQRSTDLDRQLYDGDITDPQVLESLQQEAGNVRKMLQDRDSKLMELSLRAEESRNRCAELEQRISDINTAWELRSEELSKIIKDLTAHRDELGAKRGELAESLEPVAVQKYEVLRKAKGGTAVAKVERGLCQACRMSLPTQQHQQVKSGRQTVHCSSCGRLLCQG